MNKAIVLICSLFCLATLSHTECFAGEGLKKTFFNNLTPKKYPSIGVSISLPKDLKNSVEHSYGPANCRRGLSKKDSIVLLMNPYSFGGLVESEFFLAFAFERLTFENFEVFLKGQHGCVNDWCLGYDSLSFQNTVSMRKAKPPLTQKEYLCFRRDIKLPNGDVVIASAKLLDAPDINKEQKADIESIKQILNSVKPLD